MSHDVLSKLRRPWSPETWLAEVRRFPPGDTQGILVLRLPDDTLADEIAAVMTRFLSTTMVARLPGHLVILERDRVRFRPALLAD
jgi:hypothetical protein